MDCIMIILNYNDAVRATRLADRCKKYKCIQKIIIVDNCSTDNSLDYLYKINDQKIDVIKSDNNGGFSYGNNFALRYIFDNYNPKYVLFANTDTIFEEKNVDRCIEELEKDLSLGLVSTRMVDKNGKEELATWEFYSLNKQILECLYLYRKINFMKKNNKKKYINNKIEYVDVVRGSFMCFRSKYLLNIGLFDENTFLYCEEIIISKKLKDAGYRVGFINDVEYIHNHISSNSENNDLNLFKIMQDSRYYYRTHYYKLSYLEKSILFLATKYSIFEIKIINYLKSKLKN